MGHRCSRAYGATQAGAGAILGVRLDDTPMAVAVSGLSSPEALVAWKPLSGAGAGAGGLRLYWSDVGANRIDTCFLVGTGDTLLKCGEVTALRSDVPAVTGLALDPASQTLYWADSNQMRLQAAPLSDPAAATTVFEPLRLPTAIAVQPSMGKFSGAVFFIDQATPATLSKVWLNGSGTRELMGGGLSQPRAAVYQLGACYVADPGTGSLLVVEEHGAYTAVLYPPPEGERIAIRPRGIAMRGDVDGRLGSAYGSLDSAASRSHAAHPWLLLALAVGWLRGRPPVRVA